MSCSFNDPVWLTMSTHILISLESFLGDITIGEIQSVAESTFLIIPASSRRVTSASNLSFFPKMKRYSSMLLCNWLYILINMEFYFYSL